MDFEEVNGILFHSTHVPSGSSERASFFCKNKTVQITGLPTTIPHTFHFKNNSNIDVTDLYVRFHGIIIIEPWILVTQVGKR